MAAPEPNTPSRAAAVEAAHVATTRAPHDPEVWYGLALALAAIHEPARAETALRRALAEQPLHVPALCSLCDLLHESHRADEAIALAEYGTRELPDDPSVWFKLGHLRMLDGALDFARVAFARSAALLPGYAPTHQNLGLIDEWSGRLAAAERDFRTALDLAPGSVDARFGLATVLLKQRKAEEGWRLYARGRSHDANAPRRIPARPWTGEPLRGALLVDTDQGLGDVLQFIRFATAARSRVARLVVFCDGYFAPLKALLASLPAIDAIVDRQSGAQAVAATCFASELPHLLALGDSAFAASGPYLKPPPDRVLRWAARVAPLPGFKVGICWSGNPRAGNVDAHRLDVRRSIPGAQLLPLMSIPGMTFVSLQKRGPDTNAAALGEALVDWTDELTDFAETAALIANLDLVVSVDTSVVHGAGAVGTPVWMLDRFDNCWRWGADPANPGWYEGLRVFRQVAFGDWDSVVAAVHRALSQRASAAPSRP